MKTTKLKSILSREDDRYIANIYPYDIATQWKTFDEIVYNIYEVVNLYLDEEDNNTPDWEVHYSTKETISMEEIVHSLTFDFSSIKHYASYPQTNAYHSQEHVMAV
jgi:hypothetical protein